MNAAERQRPPAGELYLDHLAHFVPDLGAAATVWEKLGFAVTPVSVHNVSGKPAGTSNRCVMLDEGYLELLAPSREKGVSTPNSRRVRKLMKRYDGVHLACFGTPDAQADHRRLADHGFEPEPVVNLERKIETGALARFKVIYAAPGKMDEGRIQYVEHLAPENVWRNDFVNPFRLTALYVVADDPAQTAARWGRFAALLPRRDGDFVTLECARGEVRIGKRESVAKVLGSAPSAPALAGYALACSHPERVAARCSKAGMAVRELGGRYAVTLPAALGGAWLLESPGKEEDPS
jgi:glyoxalase-like protein